MCQLIAPFFADILGEDTGVISYRYRALKILICFSVVKPSIFQIYCFAESLLSKRYWTKLTLLSTKHTFGNFLPNPQRICRNMGCCNLISQGLPTTYVSTTGLTFGFSIYGILRMFSNIFLR